MAPRHREIFVLAIPLCLRHVHRAVVQAHQDVSALARPVPVRVDLVVDPEAVAQVTGGRVVLIFHQDAHLLMPGMAAEVAADHLAIRLVLVEGIRGVMDADEPLPVLHELDQVVLRGIGPSLAKFGVEGALADPTLELHDSNGVLVLANDNWKDAANMTDIQDLGLAPTDDLESAILITLQPGSYTTQIRGKGNTTGVGIAEIFGLP